MSWISCRKSAVQPEPRSLDKTPGPYGPFGVPSRSLASADHQMTPALLAGAFRACGPCAPLAGGPAVALARLALRPKVSRGVPTREVGKAER